MISFRKKSTKEEDLMPEAIKYQTETEGKGFNIITPDKAEEVSKKNSKAMVLVSFVKNDSGKYQIQVKDKELYRYTRKLLEQYFRMEIVDVDSTNRVITATCNKLGIALSIIDVLREKYDLSVVVSKKDYLIYKNI
jgi:hypothetical protein